MRGEERTPENPLDNLYHHLHNKLIGCFTFGPPPAHFSTAADTALQDEGGDEHAVSGNGLVRSILSNDPEIKATLKRLNLLPQGKKPLDAPFSELAKLINERTVVKRKGKVPRWNGLTELDVIDEAWEEGIGALAALPVAWLLARARVAKGEENKEILSGFLSLQGWARIGLEQVILPSLDDMLRRKITIREAMEELAMRTVDQHTRIAWARLAADPNRDVVLLTDDGGFWTRKKKKKEFAAGQTASRLIQAIGWLRQLGLIDENGCTEHGKRYLEQIRSTLNTQGGEE